MVPKKAVKNADYSLAAELIRSIQRSEGNPDCFGTGVETCGQLDCSWRKYCLGKKRPDDTEKTWKRS